ncbi:ArsR/SmtB family transcription factor [Gordonibacter urolithinfaciens]|uniref:ArsR/SmtB family transcription factor n=1 Tax=Gordonibacter urolithinfaciens TaxID=1335613 RepID=UPI003A8F3784
MGEAGYALLFKALSDANRVKIVTMISQRGELCACKILDELGIAQPTLSHHMKVLCSCGLVKCRKEGKWMHYSLATEVVAELRRFVDSL